MIGHLFSRVPKLSVILLHYFLVIKGGGKGGPVRDAGGSLGKREAVLEEEYFHRKVGSNISTFPLLGKINFNIFLCVNSLQSMLKVVAACLVACLVY